MIKSGYEKGAESDFIFSTSEIFAAWYINDIFTLKGGYNLDIEYMHFVDNDEGESTRIKPMSVANALFAGVDADIDTSSGFDIDLTAGVRYQMVHLSSGDLTSPLAHSVSPEFGIVLKPIVEWLAIKGHVGHSFNTPSLVEAYGSPDGIPMPIGSMMLYYKSNPNLKPEEAWSYSGTVEVYPIKGMVISAGVFRSDLKNLIENTFDYSYGNGYDALVTFDNVSEAVYYGYDIGSSLSIEAGSAGIFGYNFNFEYLWAYDTSGNTPFSDGTTGDVRLDRPEYTISGNISWQKPEWGTLVRLSGTYYAPGYELVAADYDYVPYSVDPDTGEGVYLPMASSYKKGEYNRTKNGYTTLDLRLSQNVLAFVENTPDLNVWLDIKNLTDTRVDIDDDGDYDNEGISFMVGFDMKF